MKERVKSKGFTIVELIVVMAILAILIIIAVPSLTKYLENAESTSDLGTANALYSSAMSSCVNESITGASGNIPISKLDDALDIVINIKSGISINEPILIYGFDNSDDEAFQNVEVIGSNGNWEVHIPVSSNQIIPDGHIVIFAPDGTKYIDGTL